MKENWVVHPSYTKQAEVLRQVIAQFSSEGQYVVKGDRNTIKKVEVAGEIFNIKKFKTPNLFQSLVYQFLRKSKACRSFEYALKLLEVDINTPFPVAYLERFSFGLKESYYISKHLQYDFDFRVLNHNPKWPNRKGILQQMAAFTFRLHEHGIEFLDHSPGNTLIVDRGNEQYDFYLIDLNRMRFRSLNFKERMKNFRRLWLSKTMINIMAPVYASLYGTSEKETNSLMTRFSRKFQRKVNGKKLRRRKSRKN